MEEQRGSERSIRQQRMLRKKRKKLRRDIIILVAPPLVFDPWSDVRLLICPSSNLILPSPLSWVGGVCCVWFHAYKRYGARIRVKWMGLGCCAIVAAPAPAPSPTYSVGRSKTIKIAVNVKAKERNVRWRGNLLNWMAGKDCGSLKMLLSLSDIIWQGYGK